MKRYVALACLAWPLLISNPTHCRADAAADRAAVTAFTKQMETQRTTDAAGAITKIQQFQAEHAAMDATQLSALDVLAAKIYFENLKDTEKALSVLDSGLPRSAKADSQLPLISYKAHFLVRAGRHKEAQALIKKELPRYLAEPAKDFSYLRGFLMSYYMLARDTGEKSEYVADLRAILADHPELVAYNITGREIVLHLLGQPGKEAEALSWAKLYWMTCDYDEKMLNDMTALLQKAWVAKDINTATSTAFLKALQDNTAANPLKEIPLPALDQAKMRGLLKSLPTTSQRSRITLHLLLGEPGEAMLAARRLLLDNPSANATLSALEIARVFKATDLNLVRANAFLQYFQSNQGANPLDEFFKEHPVGDGAKTQ